MLKLEHENSVNKFSILYFFREFKKFEYGNICARPKFYDFLKCGNNGMDLDKVFISNI